jgi:hypothetical protein
MRWRYGGLIALTSAMLCACHNTKTESAPTSTPEGNTSYHLVDTPSAPRYQLTVNEVASGAGVISRVSPVYPTEELAVCPPSIDVQAQVIVDEAGHVSDVRVDDEAQADMHRHRYIDAVRTAAKQWDFDPLEIDKWAHEPDGSQQLQSHEAKPFSLMYAFHFECHDGHTSTSMGKTP